jgi:hypothetical protein
MNHCGQDLGLTGGVAQVVECLTSKLKALSSNSSTNKKFKSWHRWLIPVILATQEAEVRRITV